MNLNNIPTFLKAASPSGLRRLMLKNNVRRGFIFDYKIMQDIQTGDWYAWYRADAKSALEDIVETSTKGIEE